MSGPGPGTLTPRLLEIVDLLRSARSRLLEAVGGLDQARLDLVPSAGRWSVGEVLHHLQLIERSVTRVLAKQLDRASAGGDGPDTRTDSVLGSLDHLDVERSPRKVPTPPGFVPTRGLPRRELLDGLASSRAALLAEVQRGAAHDLGRLTFPHPVLGRLDLYQWLLYVARHELRHLHQVEGMPA